MKIFTKYVSYSKMLVSALVAAFFAILAFDGYIVMRLLSMIEGGVSLMYATVIGTIVSVMSTFSNGVIMFGVKNYLEKAARENVAGYDAKTNTTSDERMKMMMNEDMNEESEF